MSNAHRAFILIQLLTLWMWSGNAHCCNMAMYSFTINSMSKCSDFPKAVGIIGSSTCTVGLCGDGKFPGPCCGVGRCNIFCCNCDQGCWPNVKEALAIYLSRV